MPTAFKNFKCNMQKAQNKGILEGAALLPVRMLGQGTRQIMTWVALLI